MQSSKQKLSQTQMEAESGSTGASSPASAHTCPNTFGRPASGESEKLNLMLGPRFSAGKVKQEISHCARTLIHHDFIQAEQKSDPKLSLTECWQCSEAGQLQWKGTERTKKGVLPQEWKDV